MKHAFRSALALAAATAAFEPPRSPRVESVRLPVRATADPGVRRRSAAAGETAVTLAPVSICAAEPDDDASIQAFALAQFPPRARRLALAMPPVRKR